MDCCQWLMQLSPLRNLNLNLSSHFNRSHKRRKIMMSVSTSSWVKLTHSTSNKTRRWLQFYLRILSTARLFTLKTRCVGCSMETVSIKRDFSNIYNTTFSLNQYSNCWPTFSTSSRTRTLNCFSAFSLRHNPRCWRTVTWCSTGEMRVCRGIYWAF